MYLTKDVINYMSTSSGSKSVKVILNENVEYADKYANYINISGWTGGESVCGPLTVYIDIDLNKTKCRNSDYIFSSDIWRKVPWELVDSRINMLEASSVNQTALAITREGMDRVDRGEQSTFIYQMEENGIKHSWTYKRN